MTLNLANAVDLAVENMAKSGLSDITAETLEQRLIDRFRDEFKDEVSSKINRGNVYEMEFKAIQHLLAPKNRFVFDYRKAAIIDPTCLAKYFALVLMAAEDIENARIPTSDEIIFSARLKLDDDSIFDPAINYNAWRERTRILADADNCSFVVNCDIAAFYDRINIHRIESTLSSIGVSSALVENINQLLLFWSKKDSYGIPVGNVPSRILAEAALIDIDQYLLSEKINFVRYVDDYKLFAPNLVVAQRWMNKLTTRLFRDGLMLNTSKTHITEAYKSENTNDQAPQEDEADVVLKSIKKLTGGYNRIVRTFIMPAEEKHSSFKNIELSKEIDGLDASTIVEFSSIQKIVIACLVQEAFEKLPTIARICSKYMYALDYFVDMLLKNKQFIPTAVKKELADYYSDMVMNSEFYALEWHEASIAKLLCSADYFRKNALLHVFKSPNKEIVTYPSMMALEGLFDKLTRSEFRTVREWFERCDDWEKRRLIHMSSALADEERKAWGRTIRPSLGSDFLAQQYAKLLIGGNHL